MDAHTAMLDPQSAPDVRRSSGLPPDVLALAVVTALCNLHLVFGWKPDALLFFPDAVGRGEWWRVLIHPFVHVSWYHLALDAGGFFLLYLTLPAKSPAERLLLAAGSLAGSIAGALCGGTGAALVGLCGLSGTAHGLMAVCGIEQVRHAQNHWEKALGWGSLAAVILKSIFEIVTGRLFLDFLHFGDIGIPLVACHAGGVVGGIVVWLIVTGAKRKKPHEPSDK